MFKPRSASDALMTASPALNREIVSPATQLMTSDILIIPPSDVSLFLATLTTHKLSAFLAPKTAQSATALFASYVSKTTTGELTVSAMPPVLSAISPTEPL